MTRQDHRCHLVHVVTPCVWRSVTLVPVLNCRSSRSQGQGGQGTGHLTLDKCNMLQSYYRNAIQNNLGNIDDMKVAVWATFHHSMSTDAQPQHEYCPKDINSWCFYQAALAADPSDEPKHDDNPCRTALSPDIAQKIVLIYKRMSDENLLKRMLQYGCDARKPPSWACVE